MTARLEDYAMIGDGQSAALVSRNGSIDWLCWPRFDSDACFAALLGNRSNGRWRLSPRADDPCITRHYGHDTLVLETDFATSSGRMRIVDFMPPRGSVPTLIRIVVGLQGEVPARMHMRLRYDYGRIPPWVESGERRMVARVGPDLTVLYSNARLDSHRDEISAEFTVREGESVWFILRHGLSYEDPPPCLDVFQALRETERFWRDWIGQFDKPTEWPDSVRRSLITLKALINRPTGGIVAAPTTSLPEVPGGEMNWDYRYCWLRDASFTLSALLNAGYHAEARDWRDWILRAIAGSPEHVQVMYRLDGSRHIDEVTVPWLSGYRWSGPVRIGNAAHDQRQLDVLGELIDVLNLADKAGIERQQHGLALERALVEHVSKIWRSPGHGIWESRGKPRNFVYSKVMAWVALDRFLRGKAAAFDLDQDFVRRMRAVRAEIHREVCDEGFHPGLGSFVQYYGGQKVDGSLLLLPLLNFLPIDDPRITATIGRIERELVEDGLVYRTLPNGRDPQGAFLACSCWLADCRNMQGRKKEARQALERVLEVGNDVGLLSEEYNIRGRHLSGNFPQALSHLTFVTAALGLSGPVLQRGGA